MGTDTAEFYLASIWKYHGPGVERVLDFLRKQHPKGQYAFEKEESWFKVSCDAGDVHSVQATFRQVHDEMERGTSPDHPQPPPCPSPPDSSSSSSPWLNPWLKVPSPSGLPNDAAPDKAAPVDQLCPASFDRFAHSKVWTRVRSETPDSISVQTFLSEDDRQCIIAASGAHVALDATGRLVYLGGPTRECLNKASKMLDNMFSKFTYVLPPPKHILYAEAEGAYRVDARFMAHVNDTMLNSTIFDPGQYPDAHLDSMFKAVFAKAACLRICLFDRFKSMEVSFFGPRVQPIFNSQARRWPLWFKRAEYASKILGVTAPKTAQNAPPQQGPSPGKTEIRGHERAQITNGADANENGKVAATQELVSVPQPIDLLADDIPSPEKKTVRCALLPTSPAASPAPVVRCVPLLDQAQTANFSRPSSPRPLLSLESDKHGYQMRLLREFMCDPYKKTSSQDGSRPASSAGRRTATAVNRNDGHAEANSKSYETDAPVADQPLITLLGEEATPPADAVAQTNTNTAKPEPEQGNLLIEIDEPPPPQPLQPPPTPLTPTPSLQHKLVARAREKTHSTKSTSKALVKRSTFASNLCGYIGRLMADLPYSKGRIRLQVEIGRIYIMDASPEGLASNAPGEPATGWPHTEITTRLDTVCVSPDSIVFTKALTLFANDIESVLGYSGGAAAGPRDVLSDSGASCSSPEWTFQEKRIVYELKCQRCFVTSTGTVKAQSPFVVEIDGTAAGAFTYSLRGVEDTRPPIWVHCIRRHWDARVVVSYSQTDKLEAAYGDFARELLRTMVVPFQVAYDHRASEKDGRSCTTKVLSARVRNVGRFVSADGESFLDVSWNRHMVLQAKADSKASASGLQGTMRFTAADDKPARGMFAAWYEASVVSAAAEEAFRENETLAAGGMAAWGAPGSYNGAAGGGACKQDEMFEAAFGPALRLVQKMDGVGVLIDNGQGDGLWTPPMRARKVQSAAKFW